MVRPDPDRRRSPRVTVPTIRHLIRGVLMVAIPRSTPLGATQVCPGRSIDQSCLGIDRSSAAASVPSRAVTGIAMMDGAASISIGVVTRTGALSGGVRLQDASTGIASNNAIILTKTMSSSASYATGRRLCQAPVLSHKPPNAFFAPRVADVRFHRALALPGIGHQACKIWICQATLLARCVMYSCLSARDGHRFTNGTDPASPTPSVFMITLSLLRTCHGAAFRGAHQDASRGCDGRSSRTASSHHPVVMPRAYCALPLLIYIIL